MIKFFRHIRQSLIMENKTSKYLKYALGEIFLVVIGILIALQINNWNEKRKLKVEEKELIANLSLSFERKLNELENKNAGRTKNLNGINRLREIISNQDSTVTETEMFGFLQDMFIWFAVNEEFSIIDMLYSSGKINLISNDSLKAKLISWPDFMEEMLEEQRVVQDLVVNKLNPLISNYISSANLSNSFEQKMGTTIVESPFPNDFEGLLKDRAFESLIAQKYIYLNTNIEDSKTLIAEAKSILELIDRELEK
ncbi:DUF6090 family protein [Winogradskyella alexanderae]|uniref:PilJ/NarX-like methyl-accepting chemotaxis transducer n=1 Tax=Winogradskyella alexanderae TaxID=2877123 RepID=A0ABS7XVM8_9FLAO|nr:DUF6090 family protein [Winogradskyella alexanderae]MCA0133815.1 hypothetical protein [Winogradskyella alexanderae]